MVNSSPRTRQRRMALRRRFRQGLIFILVFGVAMLLLWGTLKWGRSLVVKKMATTISVNSGMLQEAFSAEALVLGGENLIIASTDGVFFPAVEEGQRIRKDEVLGRLANSAVQAVNMGTAIITHSTGLVCFHIDGNEGLMTREGWEKSDLSQLPAVDKVQIVQPGTWVKEGRPLARVLDNLSNSFLGIEVNYQKVPVSPGLQAIELDRTLWIQLPGNDPEAVKVISLQRDSEKLRMVVELNGFKENLIHLRRTPVKVITNRWEGLVLPRAALVFHDEVPGLYILRKGWTRWESIEIVGETDAEIAVKGLDEGSVVVTNPGLVEEGVRLQ